MKLEFGTGSSFSRLSKKKASFLVNYAIEYGINRFDTAVNYGNWTTQPLLGFTLKNHLKKNREYFVITSKAGTHSNGHINNPNLFTPEYIEYMIDKSISDLNCTYLDKFYLHGPIINEFESRGIIGTVRRLIKIGKIRQFGLNTNDLFFIKKVASGFYKEISLLLIDYNLLEQNKSSIFKNCKENNIEISAGTVLCQGSLLQSPLESFITKGNIFYLLRFLFRNATKKYLPQARIFREYAKRSYPKEFKSIPLSFVLNNSFIESIPIGMLSKESIEKNVNIAQKPISEEITQKVGEWCLSNCQIV